MRGGVDMHDCRVPGSPTNRVRSDAWAVMTGYSCGRSKWEQRVVEEQCGATGVKSASASNRRSSRAARKHFLPVDIGILDVMVALPWKAPPVNEVP